MSDTKKRKVPCMSCMNDSRTPLADGYVSHTITLKSGQVVNAWECPACTDKRNKAEKAA